jgi:hypothetical protein
VDPVPDPYFSQNLIGSGIEPGTSGSVARNSDHETTEAVTDCVQDKETEKAAKTIEGL